MTSEVNGAPASPVAAQVQAQAPGAVAAQVAAARRRQFVVLLLVGVAGAGAVLLATRQQAAHVVVTAPLPLPRTVTPVSWQDLLPAVAALAVAALASMAAVLATRSWLRRITGLITVALGAGIAVLTAGRVTHAAALAAAGHANLSPASGAGGGIAPGSTTAGGTGGTGAAGSLTGFPAHVELAGSGWRVLILVGAAVIILVGIATVIAATKLPAMSGRYERSGQASKAAPGSGVQPRPAATAQTADAAAAAMARSSASLWESLTAGNDPTAQQGEEAD
jgi:uncharacterized membrane protein (TIGR02234 family)